MTAGDKEITLASEEVQRRNLLAVRMELNTVKKAIKELDTMFLNLQNNVMQQNAQVDELRKQLAILQQQFYQKGSTSYGD